MAKTVLIFADFSVGAFASQEAAKGAATNAVRAVIGDESGVAESSLTGAELVKVYNGLSPKPYEGGTRFTNRPSGVKRVWKLIDAIPTDTAQAAVAPVQPVSGPVLAGGSSALATNAVEPEAPEKPLDTADSTSETTGVIGPVLATSGQAIQVRWPAKARGFDAGAWLDDLIAKGLRPDAIDALISLGHNNEINPEVIKRVEDEVAKRKVKAAKAATKATKTAAKANKPAPQPRENSKKETVLKLLRRANGASATELQEETGWQAHSLRGFLSTARSNGHTITTEKSEKRGTVYKLTE